MHLKTNSILSVLFRKSTAFIILITIIGFSLRVYKIDFGLPQNFMADEPEFSELAIKYTYEFKNIVREKNYYRLIPVSYVYGTVPTYVFTLVIMLSSKTMNIIGMPFDKSTLYVILRITLATASAALIPIVYFLANSFTKTRLGLVAAMIVAVNWKLIALSHYANADMLLVVFLMGSFFSVSRYFEKQHRIYFYMSAILFGLATGTKITALISVPAFLYLFMSKKLYREFIGFGFLVLGTFMLTNPFSIIFIQDFLSRIISFRTKEAGLVFDSVDTGTFKYIFAWANLATIPAILIAVFGIQYARDKELRNFFVINFAIYIVFFSLGERRVDRWLLLLIPLTAVFADLCVGKLASKSRVLAVATSVLLLITQLTPTINLLRQYDEQTPKGKAYHWLKENMTITDSVYAVTEEGLDPLNKLNNSTVKQLNVYESEGAQYEYPANPLCFDYVVLSSKPMKSVTQKEVAKKYPFYTNKWLEFNKQVLDERNFNLAKEFTLSKPNHIELSDVYVYKRITEVPKECLVLK